MGYELLIFPCREKAQVYVDSMIKLGSLSQNNRFLTQKL